MTLIAEQPTTRFRTPRSAFAAGAGRGARGGPRRGAAPGRDSGRRDPRPVPRAAGPPPAPGTCWSSTTRPPSPAQLDAEHVGRGPVVLHLATPLDDGTWVVELRTAPDAARAVLDAEPGDLVRTGGATVELAARALPLALVPDRVGQPALAGHGARVAVPRAHRRAAARSPTATWIARYPLAAYQTVFATRPGSAEMPSAGRPFTAGPGGAPGLPRDRDRAGHPAHRRVLPGGR